MRKQIGHSLLLLLSCLLPGCATGSGGGVSDIFTATDVTIIRHHVREHHAVLEEFTSRLYAKNPKYEKDTLERQRKLRFIFHNDLPVEFHYAYRPSHEVLTAAFAPNPDYPDRVYLLSLGLAKSIREAYEGHEENTFFSGLQIPLDRLQRLHHNLSQVNWRLKTYKDARGELLFRTNEKGPDGTLNMGYEVLMTEILTRVKDDISLRGGLPGKYIFNMSTLFLGILI
ncbi:MAG: hypothetical protein AB1413_04380 [Thermodesulfobacteriota bacterium]